ncbi:hypothetical protein A2311_06000 [candidate division WOR-1 bacterium RIFOXYB2_FULL_48_7]|uniref:Methyltransferase type 11 domain-containing protein n=1 Tax=candidate division WOR-1 bacterium RIFOXYB2_FULL_48_7 TaxID=1802583 RepID=A0A1F4TQP7_UNCSA|nr:MAG: hypothetical protein A2311_06000 [candidate division WOR-1 bacterium RIFOXYB2_FULL_48_7]
MAATGRPAAEKAALGRRLQAVHNSELQRVGFHILRLLENEHSLFDLPRYVDRFYKTYIYSAPQVKILYDDIQEGAATNELGRRKAPFVYIPFELGDESLVLRIHDPAFRQYFGDMLRDPTEILFEQRVGDNIYQYMWREDYEDIRQYAIRLVFDAEARLPFARQNNQTYIRGNPEFRGLMAHQIGELVGAGKRILSIGPGQGELEALLSTQYLQNVEAIELSPAMAAVAREQGIRVHVGDAHQMTSLVSGHFDALVFPESIGYLNLETIFQQSWAILAPGGKLFIITYTIKDGQPIAGYRRQPYRELAAALAKHGFQVERARTFIPIRGRIAISREQADISQSEKEAPILYIRAGKI